jgi:hypothetical protein
MIVTATLVRRRSMPLVVMAVAAVIFGLFASLATAAAAAHADAPAYAVDGTLTGKPDAASAAIALPNVEVDLYSVSAGGDFTREATAYTDDSGHFDFAENSDLAAGTYTLEYNCRFATPYDCNLDYVYEYLGHTPAQSQADTFALTAAAPTATEDFELARGATITGVVKDAAGDTLANAEVRAFAPGASEGPYTRSGSDGSYTLPQLAAGQTLVSASYSNAAADNQARVFYNRQFWDHSLTAGAATPVPTIAGTTTPNIDFDLTEAPTIRGRIIDSSGNGVASMGYVPYEYNATVGDYVSPERGPFDTDDQGYFAFEAQPASSYKFEFSDRLGADDESPQGRAPFATSWYQSAASFAAATVVSTPNESTQVDLGSITVAPHSGAITLVGDPRIEPSQFGGGAYELTGAAVSPGSASVAAQWLRDGQPIEGASSFEYMPVAADSGTQLTVQLTATLDGYATQIFVSPPLDLRADFASAPAPSVTGAVKVGATLTAAASGWNPSPATMSWQWYRGGSPISGATSDVYVPQAADLNTALHASLTATKPGYKDVTVASPATDPVQPGTLTTDTPIISGTPVVGATLTADPGAWGPGTVAFSYQWASGGVDVSGATNPTYQPTPADLGAAITVRVTGAETAFTSASRTSAATPTVTSGPFTASPTPTISGTPAVGQPLTAVTGAWAPGTVAFTYQWLSGSTPITGATSASYTPVAADNGSSISVAVTGTETGYSTTTMTSAALIVGPGTLTKGMPTISGTATFGQTLTATVGTWGPGSVTFTYQWVRGSNDIPGATASTYTLAVADVNTNISVRVTGAEPGYASSAAVSAQTATVVKGTLSPGMPGITGTPTFGSSLAASEGSWAPGTVAFSYQWLRNGVSIPGATSQSYTLVPPDVGTTIRVTVTGAEPGYQSVSQASAGVLIAAAQFSATPVPAISGPSVNHALTATVGSWVPTPDSFSYVWLRDGVAISGAPNTQKYALATADISSAISVRVTGIKAGYSPVTPATSAAVTIQPFVPTIQNTVAPVISGDTTVGETLSTTNGIWNAAPDSYEYVWQRGTGSTNNDPSTYTTIPDANDPTYVVTAADLNFSIVVRVTAIKAGYNSSAANSSPTDAADPGTLTGATPTVSGTLRVGSTLIAQTGSWGPGAVTFSFEWFRDGAMTPVSGRTSSSYLLGATDLGASLSVRVTGHEAGYSDNVQVSSATTGIHSGLFVTPLAVPRISGTAQVGRALTVVNPVWSPAASFGYQWFAGSDELVGKTQSTYTPAATDHGKSLRVVVTGTRPGFTTAAATSASTAAVINGAFTTVPKPTISGSARVGATLRAVPGTWAPNVSGFSYIWKSGSTILPSIDSTYAIRPADLGRTITVITRSNATGYPATQSAPSSPTAKVTVGTLTAATPTIAGTARVNSTLSAHAGAWTSGTTLKFQWYRSGVAITGATRAGYLTTTADYRHTIAVRVSGSLGGYTSTARTSKATAALAAGAITTVTPTISGVAQAGATLTANHHTWLPGTITFHYQWYASGVAIPKATSSTYVIASSLVGKTILVRVTGSRTDFVTAAANSAATASVIAATTSVHAFTHLLRVS